MSTSSADQSGPRRAGSRLAYERAIRRSGLPAPARHIALTLATWADIRTGIIPDRHQPSKETLEEATGLSRGAIVKHLNALEAQGWIGRQTGGGRNRRTRFWLLLPASVETGHEVTCSEESNGSPDDLFPGETGHLVTETGHVVNKNGSPRDPKSSSSPNSSSLSLPERLIRDAAVVTEEEERDFIAWIRTKHQPHSARWWRTVASNGDFPELAAAWRANLPDQRASPPASLLPPWCGQCGDGFAAAATNPRFRTRRGQPCTTCHPDHAAAA